MEKIITQINSLFCQHLNSFQLNLYAVADDFFRKQPNYKADPVM
ncbi:MAG TPA: hypothetical protein VFN95_13325 [Flavitalea sp.]|nr:hypothetical protein [Flavitalea sp.]